MNRTDARSPPLSSGRRGRRRGVRVRPHGGRHLRADGRRRRIRRLQGARVRVPVRRQRFLEHGRAVERRRVRRVRELAPESRGRAGLAAAAQLAVPDASGWSFGLNPGDARASRACSTRAAPRSSRTSVRWSRRRRSTQYQSRSVALPPQLFSHNDQQDQWHSLKGNEPSKSGWAGRIADVLAGQRGGPAVRAERVAVRARRCFRRARRPCRTRWAPRDRSRSRPFGSDGRGARTAAGVRERRRTRATRRCTSARSRTCSSAPCEFGESVSDSARRCAGARVAAEQSVATRCRASRPSCAPWRKLIAVRDRAADVAADLLRRDGRLRHARQPDR